MTIAEILLDVAWKSAITLGATLALLHLSRQRSAAQRAWIAHIGLVATLLLPLAVTLLPRWEVAAAAPVAEIAQPVADFFEAPAALDMPAVVEDVLPAGAAPAIAAVAESPLTNLLSSLTEPAMLAALLYGVPASLLLLVMLVAVARLFALRARALVMVEQSWLTALAHAQRRMNFKHGTALLISDEIRSPVSWGVLRPVILLNEEAMAKNNDAEAIIAHELAHVARLDWASLLLARIATALFWFNPLVWLVARQAHQLREEAADDAVLRSNVNHLDYAALLVGAARHESHGFLLAANGVAPSRGSLKQRITRVLDQGQLRAPAYLGWMGICVLGAASLALPLAAFSATTTTDAVAATPLPAVAPAAVQLAQASPVPPAAPAPRIAPAPPAPQAAAEPALSGEWAELREQAQKIAEREREKAQAMVEREHERAQRMLERERDRAERERDHAERDRDQIERASELREKAASKLDKVTTKLAVKLEKPVTIDVPGAFIQALPNGDAIIKAPGVHIEASRQGAIVRAPGVNIQTDARMAGMNSGMNAGARAGMGAGIGAGTAMAQNMATPPAPPRPAGEKPTADELIQMSILGIDQRYRDELAQAGYGGLSINQLQQFKIHNVKGAWLRELAALGYPNLSTKQVTNMAIHDVSANFVRRATQSTGVKPTPEQLTQMRILGVRPESGPPDDKDKN